MALRSAARAPTPTVSAAIDVAVGKKLLGELCTSCHELDDVEKHGGDDIPGWTKVVHAMVKEGADITDEQAAVVVPLLAAQYPKR